MKFDKHCKIVARSAKYRTYNLFKSLSTRNPAVLLKAYKSYVRSILEYGSTVPMLDKKCTKILESVQNDFTRKLWNRTGQCRTTAMPSAAFRNKRLNLQSLELRRCFADMIMVIKTSFSQDGSRRQQNFFSYSQSRTRGSSVKLSYPQPKSSLRKSFFTCRGGHTFLQISKKLKIPCPIKLKSFKKMLTNNIQLRNGQLLVQRVI